MRALDGTVQTDVAPAAGLFSSSSVLSLSGLFCLCSFFLFLCSLFLSPLLTAIPTHASGVAMVSIGILMISPITKLDFNDYTELVPAFLTIVLMSFTYNVGVGMTTGLLVYPLLKLMTGRVREVPPALWVLAAMSALFFVVYPYR